MTIDPDDWAKEDCACGHRRYAHGPNGCDRTVTGLDETGLPEPIYDENTDEPFGGWPINWPPREELTREMPCPCKGFHDPEPSEPEEPW